MDDQKSNASEMQGQPSGIPNDDTINDKHQEPDTHHRIAWETPKQVLPKILASCCGNHEDKTVPNISSNTKSDVQVEDYNPNQLVAAVNPTIQPLINEDLKIDNNQHDPNSEQMVSNDSTKDAQ